MCTRQADRDKPNYLGTTHVLNFRTNTMRVGFNTKTFYIEFVLDKFVLGEVLLREIQILSKYSRNQTGCCKI